MDQGAWLEASVPSPLTRQAQGGIRAAAPNEIWHIDASVVRLLNGARVYLHAIVDNFSRKVLAFRVETTMSAATTRAMVAEALDQAGILPDHVRILTDGGTENVGISEVGDVIKHVIAQVDITQSNSMVEALWRQMKHRWPDETPVALPPHPRHRRGREKDSESIRIGCQ